MAAFTTTNALITGRRSDSYRLAIELANAGAAFAMSRSLSAAGVATGTTTSKVKTVNTLTYTVQGVFYSKGATDDFWTLSGTTVAASSWQKYLLLIDTAGAASVQEATQSVVSAAAVKWTNVSGVSAWAPFFTSISTTKAVVGVLTVATDSTHTFIPGTTLLGAAGITATYVDGIDMSILPLIGNGAGTIIGNGG